MNLEMSHGTLRSARRGLVARVFALAAALTATPSAAAQTLTDLGVLPGDEGSQGGGVSANGGAAGAVSWGPSGTRSMRWSAGRGAEDLGALPNASFLYAAALSGNGEAAAGFVFYDSGVDHAVRWTRGRGLEDLGTLPNALYGSSATGISFTGNEVTGVSSSSEGWYHAFRWTRRGMQDLGALPGHTVSYGYAISGDGEVVTGLSTDGTGDVAIRWTARGGMQRLPQIAPGDWSVGFAANRDGSALAGVSGSNAALWRDGAVRDLGTLPGGSFSMASAISADGRAVAGLCDNAAGALTACLWTERLGMVDLQQHLAALGVDLTGWTLTWATGLSADGAAIVGSGTHDGASRAWLVRVRSIEGDRGDPRGRPACPHVHRSTSPAQRLVRRPHR